MLVLCGCERQGFVLLCFIASVCLQLFLAVGTCLAAPRWNSSCRGESPFFLKGRWLLDPTHLWATFQAPVQWSVSFFPPPEEHRAAGAMPCAGWAAWVCSVLECCPVAAWDIKCTASVSSILCPGVETSYYILGLFFFILQDWIIGNKVGCKILH